MAFTIHSTSQPVFSGVPPWIGGAGAYSMSSITPCVER